jgi:hypothetical protein
VDDNTRDIEREIYEEREELGDSLRSLRHQARSYTDWRRQYQDHTGGALALAFTGGIVLGLLTARSREESAELRDRDLFETEDVPRHLVDGPEQRRSLFTIRGLKDFQDTHAGRQLSDTLYGVLDVLIGVASAKAIQMVADLVPGFRDEYEARRRHARTH